MKQSPQRWRYSRNLRPGVRQEVNAATVAEERPGHGLRNAENIVSTVERLESSFGDAAATRRPMRTTVLELRVVKCDSTTGKGARGRSQITLTDAVNYSGYSLGGNFGNSALQFTVRPSNPGGWSPGDLIARGSHPQGNKCGHSYTIDEMMVAPSKGTIAMYQQNLKSLHVDGPGALWIQWERCLVYIDDIVIMGKTFERHLQNLKLVLERLRRAGLKLKPSKCSLFQDKVVYLGHVVTRDGIHTDPEKVNAVSKWPVPTSGRDVQQFLGLVGYYRNYIQSFATIAKPLYQLTERGHACETGIGAVLSQEHDGLERVVAYASRTLSKAERKYCVTRKELLAVVTFMRHFRPYLLGHHFILRTDHSSLQWIYSMKEPEGQLARWLEQIQEFDVEVVHRRGKCHQNADALSRLQNADKSECPPKIKPPSQFSCSDGAKACTVQASKEPLSNIRELQGADEDVGPILQSVISRKVPDTSFCKGKSREFNQLVQQWEQLLFKNGILYRYHEDEGNSNVQVVVPKAARCQILKQLHEGAFGGHLGEAKTLNRLRERFYWPGYSEDAVVEWCKTCPTCAARKNPSRKSRAPLQSVTAGYPLQLVAVDIVGPLTPSKTENTYILVASDYFTRWVEAYAIPNQEAVTVANKLVDEFFCRFSVPEQLHSDQGRQFEANVMQEVCRLLQIDKTRTTPYHPQSDGLVERFNRTMLAMLASTVEEDPSNWEQHLRKNPCYLISM
eukprot:Em1159g2a